MWGTALYKEKEKLDGEAGKAAAASELAARRDQHNVEAIRLRAKSLSGNMVWTVEATDDGGTYVSLGRND
jgi:hypothetical protein